MNYINYILTGFFLLSCLLGKGQTPIDSLAKSPAKSASEQKKQRGDRFYKVQGYMASAEIYESLALGKVKDGQEAMRKLANAYRLNGDTENEELWYARFLTEQSPAIEILYYAQALRSNGKCAEANQWFAAYDRVKLDAQDSRGKDLVLDCSKTNHFKQNDRVQLAKLAGVNSEELDYSPVYFHDGIVFSSSRRNDRLQRNMDTWTNQDFCNIFYAKRIEGMKFEEARPLRGGVNKRFHDGTATFTKAQDHMFFSRSINGSTKMMKGKKPQLQLFSSRLVLGAWEAVEALSINVPNVISCHPAIAENGKFLIFASNRAGSLGGMDLYISENVEGIWSEAVNLGPTINTAGNEIFPTLVNGKLYFASNGRKGLGGLDLFSAEMDGGDFKKWTAVENLGKPFNSSRDDFGFVANATGTEGFLTSNRDATSQDDIYGWTMNGGLPVSQQGPIYAIDKRTQQHIPDAYITIKDGAGTLIQRGRSGSINHVVENGQTYYFELRKIGYEAVIQQVTSEEMLADAKYWNIEMEIEECVELKGQIKNERGELLPNTGIKLYNSYTGEHKTLEIDEKGHFSLCIACDFEYELTATAPNYPNKRLTLSTFGNCTTPISKSLILTKEKPQLTLPSNISLQDLTAGLYRPTQGQSITLAPFYYNFDDAKIRKDAELELNQVVQLLNQYPSMEILIASHTDARGEASYNRLLSQRRAESAARYLISKGINKSRILPTGFGESRLLNECRDGVKCGETAHQRNRRTEIKIIKLDNNVQVDYKDKLPGVIGGKP